MTACGLVSHSEANVQTTKQTKEKEKKKMKSTRTIPSEH